MVLVRNQAEKKNTISAGGSDRARKFRTQRAASRAPGAAERTLCTRVTMRSPMAHSRMISASTVTISTHR